MKEFTYEAWGDTFRCRLSYDCQNHNIQIYNWEENGYWGPFMTATCSLPIPLETSEVLIKDYSENAGILKKFLQMGIIEKTGKTVKSGFVCIPICRVLPTIEEYIWR